MDNDEDGFGNPDISQVSCIAVESYVRNDLDCDDSDENKGNCPSTELSNKNYIYSVTPKQEVYSIDSETNTKRQVNYFDGLGRPVQSIQHAASISGNDLITNNSYDEHGRKNKEYLVYEGGKNGSYETYFQSKLIKTYQNLKHDEYPYSEVIYEPSPLNRVEKQYGPGEAWSSSGADKPITFDYQTNIVGEVQNWDVLEDELTLEGAYSAGSLYKNITTDENGNQMQEFKDLQDQVILKRVQASENAPVDDDDWADTYYVYDDFGNLRYVLPPEAVKNNPSNTQNWTEETIVVEENTTYSQVTSSSDQKVALVEGYTMTVEPGTTLVNGAEIYIISKKIEASLLDKMAFQYRYDARQRMIEKQVLGSGVMYMIYDDRDRLVLTQDANQRADNEWLFTKYDALNRPVQTGVYTHSETLTQSAMQDEVNTFYENTSNTWYESRDNSANLAYTNTSYPIVSTDDYLTATYYDNYDFEGSADWTMSFDLTDHPSQAKTLVTGTMIKVLSEGEDSGWNQSVTCYDSRYRVSSIKAQDYQGNIDELESQYYSLVYPLVTETKHTHTHSGISTTLTETFEYDHADRLMTVTHQINDEPEVVLVTNEYNELGELVTKKLHEDGDSYQQQIDYAYNIRGWLTQINDPSTDDPTEKYFSMNLKYTDAATPQYNGNIGESNWTNPFETITHNYNYGYDAMNRLTDANYSSSHLTRDYTVNNISYDLNGNIQTLDRLGDKANDLNGNLAGQSIDELVYSYNGNQLLTVTDQSDSETGFSDGVDTAEEYFYDANGNMTEDQNKGITEITYNHLNLPELVILNPSKGTVTERRIAYIYDAAGTKHAKLVYEDGTLTKRTDYKGPFVYETSYEAGVGSESLQFINHAEGRIVMASDSEATPMYEYQYHLKDHLGNVRNTFTTNPETDQSIATLESTKTSEESQYFENYDEVTRIQAALFNHTSAIASVDSEYAMRLNGSADETIGLVRQLKVKPGDIINLEVYAKYFYHSENTDGTPVINTIAGDILNAAEYVVTESAGVGLTTFPFVDFFAGDNARADDDSAPKAYLNYLVFDNNYNPIAGTGYQQISTAAAEDGSDVAHEKLFHTLEISESGYVYIYLSNEEGSTNPVDVFFDDFKVAQQHTPIVQKDDYYPYGLTFNSYTSGTENLYKYSGKEQQKETNWYHYGTRFYDPELGRWHVIDPSSENYMAYTPYNFVGNNPIRRIDPDGNDGWDIVLGAAAAVVDNGAGGFTNVRSFAANYVTDAADFNFGQDTGDAASIGIGLGMAEGGSGTAAGGLAVTSVSGGTASPVSLPVAAVGAVVAAEGVVLSAAGAKNLASQKGRLNTEEKQQNLDNAADKGIPKSQLGPSGKPKIHNVKKPTLKSAKDAARNNSKSNSKPVKHSSDKGQKTHYHSTKNGGKLTGKDNVHYENSSSKRNP